MRDDSLCGKTFGSTPTITDSIKRYASIFIVIEANGAISTAALVIASQYRWDSHHPAAAG